MLLPALRSTLRRVFASRSGSPRPARAATRWRIAAATGGVALAAGTAAAAIVAVAPAVVRFTPASVVLNATQSDVRLIAFNERQCVALPFIVHTDQGDLFPGTVVSSHFVHGDPFTSLLLTGRVRFDAPILGVISDSSELDRTDPVLGRPGVSYPTAGAEPNRGLEAGQADSYTIAPGGLALEVTMEVPAPPQSFSDQIRVLTACCHDQCGDD